MFMKTLFIKKQKEIQIQKIRELIQDQASKIDAQPIYYYSSGLNTYCLINNKLQCFGGAWGIFMPKYNKLIGFDMYCSKNKEHIKFFQDKNGNNYKLISSKPKNILEKLGIKWDKTKDIAQLKQLAKNYKSIYILNTANIRLPA